MHKLGVRLLVIHKKQINIVGQRQSRANMMHRLPQVSNEQTALHNNTIRRRLAPLKHSLFNFLGMGTPVRNHHPLVK